MLIQRGKIELNREDTQYQAGFCMLQAELPDLVNRLHILHEEERNYYDTLRFDKRKHSYLLGRVSAKKAIGALAAYEDLEKIAISSGIFQFPIVKYSVTRNLQVCITHCENLGIAISYPEAHPLGIDIEQTDKANTAVIKEQLTADEQGLLQTVTLPEKVSTTMIWTMKEALSKVLKTGLTMDLKLLEIQSLVKVSDTVFTSQFKHLIQYQAISCLSGSYACSVVIPRKTKADLSPLWDAFEQLVIKAE
ncbi:4'-phosphopantetheinyl transferase family protein [Chitinophaga rhizophila]|uniref:4'-phosphopantetheinyl transferase superfamily protein n=1 Tax=Chitinophaga rhizophila TaxID=2866212 RepID=A0ABS7G576_9BACT|nr:4'-phosphopantetheinyl transferase superfamily protein [Chitinophaga rhizophila]MBW8682773.1 4'-phosphopantetheinyl transferase superfamily protein [Chitinophaga rhizophila]